MCYLIIKLVFSKLQCCCHYKKKQVNYRVVIYIKNTSYFRFKFLLNCNLHSIFPRKVGALPLGEVCGASASLMSVQLQSRTPSVDPAVENYFCNPMHLACEVSDPPRDGSTVARWRPRRRPRVLWSVSVPTVLPNVQIDSYLVDCEITPRTLY